MTRRRRPRREDVVDILHGVEVPDPYRWLEDGDAAEVQAVGGRPERTHPQALDARPDRGWWHERLVALMQLPVVMAVQVRGEHLFSPRAAGRRRAVPAHPALGRRSRRRAASSSSTRPPAPPTRPTPSTGSRPRPTARSSPSAPARAAPRTPCCASLDAADGRDLGEAIPDTRACSVAWEPDGSGFAYTRYPEGDQYHRTVHHHRLGDDWADDPVVWAEHPDPQAWPDVTLSPDGRWLLVHVLVGWAPVRRPPARPRDRTPGRTVDRAASRSTSAFSVRRRRRLAGRRHDARRADAAASCACRSAPPTPPTWETLVAEGDAVLSQLTVRGRRAVRRRHARRPSTPSAATRADGTPLGHRRRARRRHRRRRARRRPRRPVERSSSSTRSSAPTTVWNASAGGDGATPWFPDVAAAATASCRRPDRQPGRLPVARRHGDRAVPRSTAHDVAPGPDVADDPQRLRRVRHRRDAGAGRRRSPRGARPAGRTPSPGCAAGSRRARRGTTPGAAADKQNVFDDFHAAADWLVATGLAGRDRLAVLGRSNGGLLVGVALTQRPDLCRAVWCGVPLLDMVRFPQFLIARLWTERVRRPRRRRGVRLAARLLAVPPRRRRHVLPGDAVHDGRGRHPRRPAARPQDGGARCRPRRRGQDERPILLLPGGPRRPRRRQAGRPSGPTSSPTA